MISLNKSDKLHTLVSTYPEIVEIMIRKNRKISEIFSDISDFFIFVGFAYYAVHARYLHFVTLSIELTALKC